MPDEPDEPDEQARYRLSLHARQAIQRRGIDPDWITRALSSPAATEPDSLDRDANHALLPIPEFGGRVLRVVYNSTQQPWVVITAYFDRTRKGTL